MNPLEQNLISQDTFFGKAGQTQTYDWPNPRGYKAAVTIYDVNFGWFLVTVPSVSAINMRRTLALFGTGIGKRQQRKDS